MDGFLFLGSDGTGGGGSVEVDAVGCDEEEGPSSCPIWDDASGEGEKDRLRGAILLSFVVRAGGRLRVGCSGEEGRVG